MKLQRTKSKRNREYFEQFSLNLCQTKSGYFGQIGTPGNVQCVKNVRIRTVSYPYFPAFGLNTERYRVSLRITSNTDTFHAVVYFHMQ